MVRRNFLKNHFLAFRSLSTRFDGKNVSVKPRTLFQKVWDDHVVREQDDGTCLIYIDRHLVHEVTSPQAFEGLRLNDRKVRRPSRTLVTPDHNVSTEINRLTKTTFSDEASKQQVEALDSNAKQFQLPYFPLTDKRQGIVHIVGPEQGFSLPGLTIVCGDSHTSTHGAFGALAFGIGTSEVEHVLATQTLLQKPANNMLIEISGELQLGVSAKDLILHVIGQIGTAGGTGHVIEFAGNIVRDLSMESRMTMCNMAIEGGARAGMIAPDDITFKYLVNKPFAPKDDTWDKAVKYWSTLKSDVGAEFDLVVKVDGKDVAPQITWGTNPEMVSSVDSGVPMPKNKEHERALEYMGLKGGESFEDIKVDKIFIGSCTNGRIEDLRQVAKLVKGKKMNENIIEAMVVPGSGLVKRQAEEEGIADVLKEAGFDWRAPGCSMCLGMNEDQLKPEERCASTSNRNFEGRQGKKGRTHLVSPASAAAAFVTGRLSDTRKVFGRGYSSAAAAASADSFSWKQDFVTKSVAPMDLANVDTDMIIPAVFLKTIKRTGLGKFAFAEMRYLPGTNYTEENKDFVLNQERYRNPQVLIAGANFGCGSSREHAPWSLKDLGVKIIIAPSYADIFYNNCFKNGILPIALKQEEVNILMDAAKSGDDEFEFKFKEQIVSTVKSKKEFKYDLDSFRKHCLTNNLDDIALTLEQADDISAYEEKRKKEHPWF